MNREGAAGTVSWNSEAIRGALEPIRRESMNLTTDRYDTSNPLAETKAAKRNCVLLSLDDDQLILSNVSNNNNVTPKDVNFPAWASWRESKKDEGFYKAAYYIDTFESPRGMPYGTYYDGGDYEADILKGVAGENVSCKEQVTDCIPSEFIQESNEITQSQAYTELHMQSACSQRLPPISLLANKKSVDMSDGIAHSPNDVEYSPDRDRSIGDYIGLCNDDYRCIQQDPVQTLRCDGKEDVFQPAKNLSDLASFSPQITGSGDSSMNRSESPAPIHRLKASRHNMPHQGVSNPSSPKRKSER